MPVNEVCGVCGRPADAIATVPMCGQRPRYPMCLEHLMDIDGAGFAEDVELIEDGTEGVNQCP